MAKALDPPKIFARAVEEGQRRLDESLLELTSTGFIAGFTILFGIVALGLVEAMAEPVFGEFAAFFGALGFGIGMILLILGRAELFTENFLDPTAAAFKRERPHETRRLLRLWVVTFAFNLLGGVMFALVFAVEGALPEQAARVLEKVAEEIMGHSTWASLARAIAGGALVALMSYLLRAVDSAMSRALVAYVVGFLLAVGAFDHVMVSALHVLLGMFLGTEIDFAAFLFKMAVVTVGNLIGGLGLVTFTHIAQAEGARK